MFSYDELEDRIRVGAATDFADSAGRKGYLDPDDHIVREIYISAAVVMEMSLIPPVPLASLEAEMLSFVTGAPIYWGDFREGNFIKPLNPAARWVEFKVRSQPQVRLYGAFVRQDTFVGIMACLRKDQPNEDKLLERWEQLWGHNVDRVDLADPDLLMSGYRTVK